MRTRRVHLRVGDRYACGIGSRWTSQDITSTRSLRAVTCLTCRRTRVALAFALAEISAEQAIARLADPRKLLRGISAA